MPEEFVNVLIFFFFSEKRAQERILTEAAGASKEPLFLHNALIRAVHAVVCRRLRRHIFFRVVRLLPVRCRRLIPALLKPLMSRLVQLEFY